MKEYRIVCDIEITKRSGEVIAWKDVYPHDHCGLKMTEKYYTLNEAKIKLPQVIAESKKFDNKTEQYWSRGDRDAVLYEHIYRI